MLFIIFNDTQKTTSDSFNDIKRQTSHSASKIIGAALTADDKELLNTTLNNLAAYIDNNEVMQYYAIKRKIEEGLLIFKESVDFEKSVAEEENCM